jgi:hypothetical protein
VNKLEYDEMAVDASAKHSRLLAPERVLLAPAVQVPGRRPASNFGFYAAGQTGMTIFAGVDILM